jgi:hypothetical protein
MGSDEATKRRSDEAEEKRLRVELLRERLTMLRMLIDKLASTVPTQAKPEGQSVIGTFGVQHEGMFEEFIHALATRWLQPVTVRIVEHDSAPETHRVLVCEWDPEATKRRSDEANLLDPATVERVEALLRAFGLPPTEATKRRSDEGNSPPPDPFPWGEGADYRLGS